jgi:hypothetical protein
MTDSERDRLARQLQEEAGLHWAGSPSARRSVASLLDRAANALDALNAVTRWRPWSEMPEPQVGDKVWAYSHAEGVNVLEYDHPIHEDFDGPDEEEPPLWWMDGEDVSGPEWKFTHWMPYRVPEPPTNV